MQEPSRVLEEIEAEYRRAVAAKPRFNGPHEGWAVLFEELDELWDLVRADRGRWPTARAEAIQVAAMALRYVVDLCGDAPRRD